MKMYIDYIKERLGGNVLVTEYGFCEYYFFGDECMIENTYVTPKFRGKKLNHSMANEVLKIAKEKGCKFLTCKVSQLDILSGNCTEVSIKNIISYGFKVKKILQDEILFLKEI